MMPFSVYLVLEHEPPREITIHSINEEGNVMLFGSVHL